MMSPTELRQKLDILRSMRSENEVVEFKEAKNTYHISKIGKYVSALSNEANLREQDDAWLVFGIRDCDHGIVGSQYRTSVDKLMHLKKEIGDKTPNRFSFKEIYTPISEGMRVVLFQTPAAPRGMPISFEGHYYAREHDSLVPLGIEKLERIRNQIKKEDWSCKIIEEATIADLDNAAIEFAQKRYLEKYPNKREESEGWSNSKFLDKAKLTIKGKITRAAILLLGKEESEHFITPSECKIRWKLLDKRGDSRGYEIIHMPMLLGVNKLYSKIRILKYRYIPEGSLFPEEVDTYDSYSIREALNNCIAHQDYRVGGRINVIERPDSLTFTNKGSFLPGSVEDVVKKDIPEESYRNPFLVSAMFNLQMVDTEGGGIRRMFKIQAERYFPLPDYNTNNNRVGLTLIGKVIDLKYARILARYDDLSLNDIILLDKVQKKKSITDDELKYLRKQNLVEGRKNYLHLSKEVAQKTGQKARYTKVSGFSKDHYKDLIIKALNEHRELSRSEIDELLIDILPSEMDEIQKKNKIMNLIQ